MPLVSVPLTQLRRLVGRDLGRDELVQALQDLGSDVEGRAVLLSYRCGRCGQLTEVLEHEDFNQKCVWCGSGEISASGSTEVVRINLLPVRPDMFDVCGMARAVRGYLGIETGLPKYEVRTSNVEVTVKPGLEQVRPYVVCCIVRGLVMDDDIIRMLMKMQENLHWALGRDRRRASIGIYDLDTVKPGFEYRPVGPDELQFTPLFGMPEGVFAATPREILDRHPKGARYKHLLEGVAQYPLLCDSQARVLSMPPIINSQDTRVTADTRNLFVDITGPDHNAITRTLAVVAASLADLGAVIETVEIAYPDGRREVTPDLSPGRIVVHQETVEQVLGFKVADLVEFLGRMRFGLDDGDAGDRLSVLVPAYRADIMHEYDVIEDIGIAYGYHNIKPRLVPTLTVGRPQPIEELSEICRRIMTGLGYIEIMTLVLTCEDEHFQMLGLPVPAEYCRIDNPASSEQTMVRSHLLSGLLATFRLNTTRATPQALFEAGDCFVLDQDAETGVRCRRKLAVGLAGPRAGFADARQLSDTLSRELDTVVSYEAAEHPAFIPGRCARVFCRRGGSRLEWGVMGEVHPEVLERFGLAQPVVLLELTLDVLL